MDNNTPPPNDPYGYNQQNAAPEPVQNRDTQLSGGKGKTIIIGIGLLIFVGFMLNSIFGGSPPKETGVNLRGGEAGKENQIAKNDQTGGAENAVALPPPPKASLQPPPQSIDSSLLPPPELPPVLETQAEIVPPPPPPLTDTSSTFKGKTDKEVQTRIRSNMLIVDGGKTEGADAGRVTANSILAQGDANRAFSDNVIKGTSAEKESATRLNNLGMTIAQGKIVNAVLETAVNTELPGTLRAIVSRDTYAETGRTILIPKGSRLIGTYNTGILRGQSRVMIIWTRLIRPDGIDIMIGSPGVDGLGRAGVEGFADNRYMEIFSAAILTTALSIGAAVGSDKVLPDKSTTTTSSGGTTTTNVSPAQTAAGDAVQNLTAISKNVVQNIIDIRPTVTIDQGTRVNVFVNRDLTFPPELNEAVFVP